MSGMDTTIVRMYRGSRVHGLATARSDVDTFTITCGDRALYLTADGVIEHWRDGDDNIFYDLRKFCRMVASGDISAVEALFTPSVCLIESSDRWDHLIARRDHALTPAFAASLRRSAIGQAKAAIARSNPKQMSHALRASQMLRSLMADGTMWVTVPNELRPLHMEIRSGAVPMAEAKAAMLEELDAAERFGNSKLAKGDTNHWNRLPVDLIG